jgi:hypothetical protein
VKSKNGPEAAPSVVGSLPEKIEPSDLCLLNEALAYLFQELHRASALYKSNPIAGREGAIHSVETVVNFLSVFAPVISASLHAPLATLFDALMYLDDGRVLPLLKPAKKTGRARASAIRESLIGATAFTVKRLTETGMTAPDAHKAVARILGGIGIKPARGRADNVITARTIGGWCEQVRADVGRYSTAAQTYDLLISDPRGSTANDLLPAQARSALLEQLAKTAKKIRADEGA